jgi:hypothetical protein
MVAALQYTGFRQRPACFLQKPSREGALFSVCPICFHPAVIQVTLPSKAGKKRLLAQIVGTERKCVTATKQKSNTGLRFREG